MTTNHGLFYFSEEAAKGLAWLGGGGVSIGVITYDAASTMLSFALMAGGLLWSWFLAQRRKVSDAARAVRDADAEADREQRRKDDEEVRHKRQLDFELEMRQLIAKQATQLNTTLASQDGKIGQIAIATSTILPSTPPPSSPVSMGASKP